MPFQFEKTYLKDVCLVKPRPFKDSRGFFLETFKASDFKSNGLPEFFPQTNHSYSNKNVIRGIHFQKSPKQQGKLVRCIKGCIFDVAVDLRPESPTFKMWYGWMLSCQNKHMLYIPEGFGHGFSVLSEDAEIIYMCTNEYDASLDSGIRYDDPDLKINWHVSDPVISDKDKKLPYLSEVLA